MNRRSFRIGTRELGDPTQCFVIAEVGVNHNGDLSTAHALIDAAAEGGADAVKFQIFAPDLLASAGAQTAPYQGKQTGIAGQRSMLESLVLPIAAWSELAAHARDAGLVFFATPFDCPSAELLVSLAVPLIKVPSGELNNLRFIESLAAFGLPLLISTGMGTMDEVASALDAAAAASSHALMHCVTAYPAPPESANLACIPAMGKRFGVPVGWSDHTIDATTAIIAVGLGASVIEKHLTLNRSAEGPDHAASVEPDAFSEYVSSIRDAGSAIGDGRKRPMPVEEENRVHARRSVHAVRDLPRGHLLTAEDVVLLRPATGLPADTRLEGLHLARDISAGMPITSEDLA